MNATPMLSVDQVPLRTGLQYGAGFDLYLAEIGDASKSLGGFLAGARVAEISTPDDAGLSVRVP